MKKKFWANLQRIIELLTQKIVIKLSKVWVWDPGSRKNLFWIPDPKVKKAPDPRSGSATLHENCGVAPSLLRNRFQTRSMPPHAPATGSSPQPASPHEAGTTKVSIKTLTKNFGMSENYQNFKCCGSKTIYFGSGLGKVPDPDPDLDHVFSTVSQIKNCVWNRTFLSLLSS